MTSESDPDMSDPQDDTRSKWPEPSNETFWLDFFDHHFPDELLTPLLRIEVNPNQP
jgi:hypothetical protein